MINWYGGLILFIIFFVWSTVEGY